MTIGLMTFMNQKLKILNQVILIIFLSFGLQAFGQNDYRFFRYYESFTPDSTGIFYAAIDNVNFFKNNEYKSEFATGYTLTGAWLRPKIVYYPDKKLRIELGGNVLKYNGRDQYYHVTPWFNVHYQPTEKISVILGNLNSDRNHNLPEFLSDPERFLTSKPEAGIQAKYYSRNFTTDFWIDWQQFIVKGDPFKEQFVFGVAANWKLFEKESSSLSLPFAFYGLHQGGEIDNAPGFVKSFISITPGLSLKKNISGKTFKEWGLNSYFTISTYPKDNVAFKESNGWGVYLNGTIESCFGGLTAAYWRGHQFYTPQGGSLYQNLSSSGMVMIPENELLNLKYHFCHEIFPNTYFGFVFDYYYDPINKRTMNSEGLYLIVNFGISSKFLNHSVK